MRALDRKLLRDVWQMKGQLIAIGLVIACGVATFVMMLSALHCLRTNRARYYEQYRFAQVFARLKRAPNSLLPRIARLPGVARAQTRVVMDVTLDMPTLSEPAIGRLISVPERTPPLLNGVYLRSGRYLEPGRPDEILASESFVKAHKLHLGDRVTAVINGRQRRLVIVGIALSPEYIYLIRPGQLVPDDLRFGVFWMGRTALGAAFNMEGGFNDVCLELMPGANEEEVIDRLDDLIEPYGGLGSHGREDQISYRFLADEIAQLQRMGLIVPSVFLAVAAFLLNVVLSRIISLQREQIAALKAFGYSNLAVGVHYLKLVFAVVAGGMLLGTLVGTWLGRSITHLYSNFYKFPSLEFELPPHAVGIAFLVSSGAAILGTLNVIRLAVRLPPAEAMRPEPPPTFKRRLFERLGLLSLLSPAARMVFRHLQRRPFKAFLSALGISMSIAILILGSFSADALDHLLHVQFFMADRQNVTVTFVEPASYSALYEIEHLPGVLRAEPFRAVPVRIEHAQNSRRVIIRGLAADRQLTNLMDEQQRSIGIPPAGLVVNTKLAELLGVRIGDEVTVHVLEGPRPIRTVPIAGFSHEFLGTSAYMDLSALNRLMREGPVISGVLLNADATQEEALYRDLKETPRVAAVTVKSASIKSFRETLAENMLQMQRFNVIFACIIAFGVVYNTARIALSERGRELASLRVIGFTRFEISAILLGELGTLTLLSIPLGLLIGDGIVRALSTLLDTEMYRIPYAIAPKTYAMAVLVVVVASVLSGLVVRRQLDKLDLIAVLKMKE